MNLVRETSVALVRKLAGTLPKEQTIEVAVCPPTVYLHAVGEAIQNSIMALGAQNMHYETEGAYTGEISGSMLKDMGCRYVILGHSERRQLFGETDELVNRKMMAALNCSLVPIVCVGETLTEREDGRTARVIERQICGSLAGLEPTPAAGIVIAYEPVWAIGTGRTATPAQAEEVHSQIRELLDQRFGTATAQAIRIQYGGSVKPENAGDLMSQLNIDGALVGGASLQAESFSAICMASCEVASTN